MVRTRRGTLQTQVCVVDHGAYRDWLNRDPLPILNFGSSQIQDIYTVVKVLVNSFLICPCQKSTNPVEIIQQLRLKTMQRLYRLPMWPCRLEKPVS